ncbi:hypothetical protein AADG64_09755 [Achromobacter xylosoxidans]|uniref:hypothetical protein n=1 Tax=Alcaligenes xylosoxydans xylosoxydans TaxID=85698 RepID=UPI003369CDBC
MRWIKHDAEGNRLPGDYEMQQEGPGEWVDPAEVPVRPTVSTVSRFQLLAALMQGGLLDEVTAWANAPTTDPLHKLAFDTAAEFTSTSVTLVAGAQALGWPPEQLENLLEAAKNIVA